MRREDVKLLKRSGADELYCGYVDDELTKRWPLAFNVLNRRGENQSFENYETFKQAVAEAQRNNLPVYVTLNGLYTLEQYPFLLNLIDKIVRLKGVKGIIVADLGLLLTIKKSNFNKEIHLSTGGNVFNSETADFYSHLGVKRLVLDRQLTVNEIADIISRLKSKIAIEIFIISGGCGGFIDGMCTFFHCFENEKKNKIAPGVFLFTKYNIEQDNRGCVFHEETLRARNFKVFNAITYKEENCSLGYQPRRHASVGCRICDLYKLYHYPIKSLKIIGRGISGIQIARQVKLIAQVRSWLEDNDFSEKKYKHKCRSLFSKVFFQNSRHCSKIDCYFDTCWVKKDSLGDNHNFKA